MKSKSEMKRIEALSPGSVIEYAWKLRLQLSEIQDFVDQRFPDLKKDAGWQAHKKTNKELLEVK